MTIDKWGPPTAAGYYVRDNGDKGPSLVQITAKLDGSFWMRAKGGAVRAIGSNFLGPIPAREPEVDAKEERRVFAIRDIEPPLGFTPIDSVSAMDKVAAKRIKDVETSPEVA
jgi:hypothetical protein